MEQEGTDNDIAQSGDVTNLRPLSTAEKNQLAISNQSMKTQLPESTEPKDASRMHRLNLLSHDVIDQHVSKLESLVEDVLRNKDSYCQNSSTISDDSEETTFDSVTDSTTDGAKSCLREKRTEGGTDQNQPEIDQDTRNLVNEFHHTASKVLCSRDVVKMLTSRSTPRNVRNPVLRVICEIVEGNIHGNKKHAVILKEERLYEAVVNNTTRIIWQDRLRFSHQVLIDGQLETVYMNAVSILAVTTKHGYAQQRSIEKAKHAVFQAKCSNMTVPVKLLHPQPKQSESRFRQYKVVQIEPSEFFSPLPNIEGSEFSPMQFHLLSEVMKLLLNSDYSQGDCPIDLSEHEQKIVGLKYNILPTIVCGRSGTGKTTICLYRMYNEFKVFCETLVDHKSWEDACKTPTCENSKTNISKAGTSQNLKGSCSFHSVTATEANRRLEIGNTEDSEVMYECEEGSGEREGKEAISRNEDEEEMEESENENFLRLAFITKNQLLSSQIKKKFHSMATIEESMRKVMSFKEKIPNKFGDVKDEQYPLFLTSRQFLLMLDASVDGEPFFHRNEDGSLSHEISSSEYSFSEVQDILEMEISDSEDEEEWVPQSTKKQCQCVEITADYFAKHIWNHIMTVECKKNRIDPLLVWMEIKSVIKGSKKALQSQEGHLSLEEYMDYSERAAPNFTDSAFCRSNVYQLFLKYKHFVLEKTDSHLFDECTLVWNLFKRIKTHRHPKIVSHFYIDEVQDFTQAELALLLCCSYNQKSTFCTGDTAQSIMKGVAFRFEDLKTQFWDIAEKDPCKSGKRKAPGLHMLCDNFRCHSGILKLAQSIIDLLKEYFSHSFDNLPVERAAFHGPKPILLEPTSSDDLALVLLGNQEGTSTIDFGAHQVIIVRNDEAKNKLPDCIREGIVLTILEAKGLEFDDVLLYNFFTDSEVYKCKK